MCVCKNGKIEKLNQQIYTSATELCVVCCNTTTKCIKCFEKYLAFSAACTPSNLNKKMPRNEATTKKKVIIPKGTNKKGKQKKIQPFSSVDVVIENTDKSNENIYNFFFFCIN